jgi:hypothetical protein
MLRKRAPMDDEDLIDLLERELEQGVQFDCPPESEEDSQQSLFGGLVTAEEHVTVHEMDKK